jgi:hypothetical protein
MDDKKCKKSQNLQMTGGSGNEKEWLMGAKEERSDKIKWIRTVKA